MNIEYRKLTASDFDQWNRVRTLALDFQPAAFGRSNPDEEPVRKELFNRNTDQEDRFILGAFKGEELIGIAGLFRHEPLKVQHKSMVWSVFVIREYQGRGIGRALMERTIELAKQIDGIDLILIGVSAYNSKAHELYQQLGFVDYGTEPRSLKINGEYFDEILMWLDLTK